MLPTALVELQQYKQFVCWMKENVKNRITKVPYNPLTGEKVSVTDPSTWVDYFAANEAIGTYDGIGFVLTQNDPYIFIDLDKTSDPIENNRNLELATYFNSYTEYSPNGGLHVIGKGNISKGKRNSHREIYSSERYMTITGNTLHNLSINIIKEESIQSFYKFLGNTDRIEHENYETCAIEVADKDQILEDSVVWHQCINASNGNLFTQLWKGDCINYSSQSEADQALMNIIAFHSRNNAQVKRLFRYSGLGQRSKADIDGYLNLTLKKARDQQTNLVTIIYPQDLTDNSEEEKAAVIDAEHFVVNDIESSEEVSCLTRVETPNNDNTSSQTKDKSKDESKDGSELDDDILKGMGLVGSIASYLYSQSPRQSRIYSLVNAMGLIAGITGRKYNVSNTGLNLYFLMLGTSGSGKEGPRSGISRLMHAVSHGSLLSNTITCPDAVKFISSHFAASGQGLLKQLSAWPSFLSWRDEFGGDLDRMYRRNANGADRMFKDIMLSAFSKSGKNEFIEGSAYSDTSKNVGLVRSPAMSVLFASVPDRVYEAINVSMISDGFLPRFVIVEEKEETPFNACHDVIEPSKDLVDKVSALCSACLSNVDNVIDCTIAPSSLHYSLEIRDYFNKLAKREYDTGPLWERAHLKTLKIAAIMSFDTDYVGINITERELYYAFRFVLATTQGLENKFVRNTLGIDDTSCIGYIKEAVDKLLIGDYILPQTRESVTYKFLLDRQYIPYSVLSSRVLNKPPFRVARDGPTNALKRILVHLEACGHLVPSSAPTGSTYKGRIYVKGSK